MIGLVEQVSVDLVLKLKGRTWPTRNHPGLLKTKVESCSISFLEKVSMVVLLEAESDFGLCSDCEIGPWAVVGTAMLP